MVVTKRHVGREGGREGRRQAGREGGRVKACELRTKHFNLNKWTTSLTD